MRPKRKPLLKLWKRRAGAAKTQRRCWASVTRHCSTKSGNSISIPDAPDVPKQLLPLQRPRPPHSWEWVEIPTEKRKGENDCAPMTDKPLTLCGKSFLSGDAQGH